MNNETRPEWRVDPVTGEQILQIYTDEVLPSQPEKPAATPGYLTYALLGFLALILLSRKK